MSETMIPFVYDDGGRTDAGFKGETGDCVARSIAIAAGLPYRAVYDALSEGCRAQRVTKRVKRKASARNGVYTRLKWFKEYMTTLGFEWVSTMGIGTGCKVHLVKGEIPSEGRIIAVVSKHYTAVIDGVIHDIHNPQREVHTITPFRGQELKPGETLNANGVCSIRRRCVYGYWRLKSV